ncbi:hypothetical protein ACI6PS_14660 [Flavobacterium sp. PLA-1-15]|uniref:hypothetical protein n=1 Tax=Flavobacterium sp. PLA-1-15 TaxID=3380533 RepID=UPI003B7DA58A
MKKRGFTLEEYVPGGTFLLTSFKLHLKLMEVRFRELTPAYEAAFEAQLAKVDVLESSLVKTERQKQVTQKLYLETGATTADLEYLAYYLRRAKLGVKVLSAVRKDLKNGNVEGACKGLEDVIQYVKDHSSVLEVKGLDTHYVSVLRSKKDSLLALNVSQNEFINARKKLTSDNKGEYAALYEYISAVAEAGKIFFAGKKEEDEYTISKILARLRSGNSGGDDKKDVIE